MLRVKKRVVKKKRGIAKALDEVSRIDLEKLSTGALLARLNKIRWCYENFEAASDYSKDELIAAEAKILFKSDLRWKKAYRDVKQVLASR